MFTILGISLLGVLALVALFFIVRSIVRRVLDLRYRRSVVDYESKHGNEFHYTGEYY